MLHDKLQYENEMVPVQEHPENGVCASVSDTALHIVMIASLKIVFKLIGGLQPQYQGQCKQQP